MTSLLERARDIAGRDWTDHGDMVGCDYCGVGAYKEAGYKAIEHTSDCPLQLISDLVAHVKRLTEALEAAQQFIAEQHADPTCAAEGEWVSKEARPVHDLICDALHPRAALKDGEQKV